jgi:hypothetical protein
LLDPLLDLRDRRVGKVVVVSLRHLRRLLPLDPQDQVALVRLAGNDHLFGVGALHQLLEGGHVECLISPLGVVAVDAVADQDRGNVARELEPRIVRGRGRHGGVSIFSFSEGSAISSFLVMPFLVRPLFLAIFCAVGRIRRSVSARTS